MFDTIKLWLMGIVSAIIGFFIWKNNHDRKVAEEELESVKDQIQDAEVETAKRVEQAKGDATKKELETKIKVLKEIGNKEDTDKISELENQIKDVENGKNNTITV